MQISKKQIQALLRLAGGSTVRSSELTPVISNFLLSNKGINLRRTGKKRGVYYMSCGEAAFRHLCAQFDARLESLERALAFLENGELSPVAETLALHDSKAFRVLNNKRRRNNRGFLIKSNSQLRIRYKAEMLSITDDLVFCCQDSSEFEFIEQKPVIFVENWACFENLTWLSFFFPPEKEFYIICRSPMDEITREKLLSQKNDKYYFGDYDLAGIAIYQSEFFPNISPEHYLIPQNVTQFINEYGNTTLYDKQVKITRYNKLKGVNKSISDILAYIRSQKKCLEQEAFLCHEFIEKNMCL